MNSPQLSTVGAASPQEHQLSTYLDVATTAALAAGEVLQACWGKLESIVEKGRPGDLVTEADKQAEAAILAVIRQHFPDHSILAEESGQFGDLDAEYLWAIDPLDGTTNYAHQYPFSAASIGLLINGVPTVGAIFDPFEAHEPPILVPSRCRDRALHSRDEQDRTREKSFFPVRDRVDDHLAAQSVRLADAPDLQPIGSHPRSVSRRRRPTRGRPRMPRRLGPPDGSPG